MNYAIIAAGEGSRLAQEGVKRPKPLVELNGEPMIGRLIRIFTRCKAESINIIVNQEMTDVKKYLDTVKLDIPLNIVVKSTPSSMHSFYELSRIMPPGKFCLTTVDTIFKETDFARYISAYESADGSCDGMMAVTPFIDDEKPLYVDVDNTTMQVRGFLDNPFDGVKYISGGIYALDGKAIKVLEQCMQRGTSRMRNFQRALIEAGLNLRAFPIDKIVDVDHAGDIATAERFILEQ